MIFLLLGVIDFLYVFFCFENQVHLPHISPFLPEFLERSLKRTAKSPWKYRKILKRHFHLNQPLIFKGKELLVSGREKFPTEKCSPNTKKKQTTASFVWTFRATEVCLQVQVLLPCLNAQPHLPIRVATRRVGGGVYFGQFRKVKSYCCEQNSPRCLLNVGCKKRTKKYGGYWWFTLVESVKKITLDEQKWGSARWPPSTLNHPKSDTVSWYLP